VYPPLAESLGPLNRLDRSISCLEGLAISETLPVRAATPASLQTIWRDGVDGNEVCHNPTSINLVPSMNRNYVNKKNPMLDARIKLKKSSLPFPEREKARSGDPFGWKAVLEFTPFHPFCAWCPDEIFWILDSADAGHTDIRKTQAQRLDSQVKVVSGSPCRADDSYYRGSARLETRITVLPEAKIVRLGYRYWTFDFTLDVPKF
jgi:hypothetical protein